MTEEEWVRIYPSGNGEIFYDRVSWAKSYLRKAGLIDYPARSFFQITKKGHLALQKNSRLDAKILRDQFGLVRHKRNNQGSADDESKIDDSRTPAEQIASASAILRESLGEEILAKLKTVSSTFFERLVVELLMRMGYGGMREGAGSVTGGSGDGGIDGLINEDRLGLDVIYLQAKRWEQTVGRPEIQKFAGALQGVRARKGIFITTSDFSREAAEYAAHIDSKISLIDGERLCNLMMDFGLGVSTVASYEIKKIDHDYFDGETA